MGVSINSVAFLLLLEMEFRVPLPLTVEEFHRGQLFAVAECSKNETGGGEGVEFVKQEVFESDSLLAGSHLKGMYTYKIYRLKSKAPWVMQKTLPAEAFEVHEECWNAYPYCKTILTNPGYMKKNFHLIIETTHLQDNGSSANPLNGPETREIQFLDICDDSVIPKDAYDPGTDPKKFRSTSTPRCPLSSNWMQNGSVPVMCAYKLVTLQFKWTGLGGMIEKTIIKQYPKIFTKFHRDAVCWIDSWLALTMEDIRKLEEQTAIQLRKQLAEAEKRGTTCNDTPDRGSKSFMG